jgi:TolB-like protein/class 3 adenylate cyclase/Tfp pilus assembly protein PilF
MERKLTAILCADVHGYSRLMGENEEATFRTLSSHRKVIDGLIELHHGRFVGSAGDSVLAEFASVVNAVQCAVEIQFRLKEENERIPSARRMEFRIGVNLGDVIVDGEQLYGDGINVAARLESLAAPGAICISRTVHENIRNKLPLTFEDLGEQAVKNIAEPVHVWRVLLDGTQTVTRRRRWILHRYWRYGALSLTGIAIAIATIVLVQHVSLKPPRTSASIPPQEKKQNPHPYPLPLGTLTSPLPQHSERGTGSGRGTEALPLPSIPSIAVLPFMNLSGDPQQEYFSDGISDQLINDLSRLPGIFVIARNSSFAYKGKPVKEHEISKELGVKYLLEGSVRKAFDRIRIGVELVNAGSSTEIWTQRFDRPLKDIFAVQDEIVGKVVTTLGLLFKLDQMKLPYVASWRRTDNLEAFDDFLRAAEYSWRLTKDDDAKARRWLEKVIALDPKFAQAYVALGSTYWWDAFAQWSRNPQADLQRASDLAHQALALDDSNSSALGLLSRLDWMQRRFDQSVADAERAVAIDPNYASGYWVLSEALLVCVKPEGAISAAKKAMRLDPAGQDLYAFEVGLGYLQMGRQQEAIPVLKSHLAAYPNNLFAHLDLMIAYIELGRDPDARAELTEVARISPQFVLPPPEGGWFNNVALNRRWDGELRKAGLK